MLSNSNNRALREAAERIGKQALESPLHKNHAHAWAEAKARQADISKLLCAFTQYSEAKRASEAEIAHSVFLCGDILSLGFIRKSTKRVYEMCLCPSDSSQPMAREVLAHIYEFMESIDLHFSFQFINQDYSAELRENPHVYMHNGTAHVERILGLIVEHTDSIALLSRVSSAIGRSKLCRERLQIKEVAYGMIQVAFPKSKRASLADIMDLYGVIHQMFLEKCRPTAKYAIQILYGPGELLDCPEHHVICAIYRLHTDQAYMRLSMHLHMYLVQNPILQTGAAYVMHWVDAFCISNFEVFTEQIVSYMWIYFLFHCRRELTCVSTSRIRRKIEHQDAAAMERNSRIRTFQGCERFIGERIIDFFVFYSQTFNFSSRIVTLCEADGYPGTLKDWITCKKAFGEARAMGVEDPITHKNLAKQVDMGGFKELKQCMKDWLRENLPDAHGELNMHKRGMQNVVSYT